jgi:hypothetical protein
MQIRNRIKELRHVPASDLRPNPKNWRTHPKAQQDALKGILAEVGMADACLARELDDGSLMLIDGHLRAETIGTEVVPVLILDVDEAEADKILATLDPLAALAGSNDARLSELASSVRTDDETLRSIFESMCEDMKDVEKAKPEEPTPSTVRMVQLFFDDTNIGEFQALCQGLAERYDSSNITETVLAAVLEQAGS